MMHKKLYVTVCLFAAAFCQPASLFAEWVWSPELGKFVSTKEESRDNSSQQFDYAMELYRQKSYDKAAGELEELMKQSPASRIAPEAQYRLGTIYEEKGDYFKALKAYQKLIEIYPQNDRFEEVIEREFKLGQLFLSGKKGRFYGIEIRPALPIAIQAFEHIVKFAPYGAFGDQAQFNMALSQKRAGQFEGALQSFQDVIDHYPQSSLIEQARYELAETAYFRSIAQNRDERALENASEQVRGFMERYPSAAGTEKAAKISEEIDEKNAQKNYEIGRYYEKDNFVQSALIYYQDVAKRYPHTQWGAKSQDRLRALKQPVQFLASENDKLDADYDDAQKRLAALSAGADPAEREALQRKLERIEKRRKSLEKEKGESMTRLSDDLKRREADLKQKFKNLDEKIKKHKGNQSEDFQRAIERWRASLETERDALEAEKQQMQGWRSELGMGHKPFYDGWMPFTGEPKTPVEKIQAIDAKDLYKISEKKKKNLDEKETLYKQYNEVSALAGGIAAKPSPSGSLRKDLSSKVTEYESKFGEDDWSKRTRERHGLGASGNAFKDTALGSKNPQELLELRMHLREQVAAAQNVVDTLSTAFNEELALSEQERLAEKIETSEKVDPQQIRKEIKKVEKSIRGNYEDIEDRDKRKKKLLDELDHLVGNKADKTLGEKVSAPVLFPVKAAKVFLFGRENSAGALTRKAGKSNDQRAQDLKKEIEVESLMIQAEHEEILQLEKNLEILRAQASLAGGAQFRSAMVTVPYVFIDDAVANAEKLITPDERQDLLIEKLGQKTKELEALKRELEQVDAAAAKLPKQDDSQSGRENSRKDIEKLSDQLLKEMTTPSAGLSEEQLSKADKKTLKELREIENSLFEVISEQIELDDAEKQILSKRMTEADRELQSLSSKALRGDLVTERERMDQRITELTQQRDFLEKEKLRFSKND